MRHLIAALIVVLAAAPAVAQEKAVAKPSQGRVDVVFCIDCSGSMGPYIETAKQKVWAIVTEIAKVRPTPILRIGYISYGNGAGPFPTHGLTDDLDKAYANLVSIKEQGWGAEFVGLAIRKATEDMDWSKEKDALRMIFVLGNETARQGPEEHDYTKTVPEAIKKDVTVNMIYAGDRNGGTETWQEAAKLGDGAFTAIATGGGAIVIETPMDKELIELNTKLNATYVPFGKHGAAGQKNQSEQDSNSGANGGASNSAQRAQAKAWSGYNCRDWDLVDASKETTFKLEDVKAEDLPKEMQSMSLDEKRAHIEKKRTEREALTKQINDVGVKRQKFIDDEIKARNLTPDKAFDEAVRKAIRAQATARGYSIEEASK